jgi:hypothetical protein
MEFSAWYICPAVYTRRMSEKGRLGPDFRRYHLLERMPRSRQGFVQRPIIHSAGSLCLPAVNRRYPLLYDDTSHYPCPDVFFDEILQFGTDGTQRHFGESHPSQGRLFLSLYIQHPISGDNYKHRIMETVVMQE